MNATKVNLLANSYGAPLSEVKWLDFSGILALCTYTLLATTFLHCNNEQPFPLLLPTSVSGSSKKNEPPGNSAVSLLVDEDSIAQ